MAAHEDQTEAEVMTTGMKTAWCPTCGTPQDVAHDAELDDCKCIECNQSLGEEPHESVVEEEDEAVYKALSTIVEDALGA